MSEVPRNERSSSGNRPLPRWKRLAYGLASIVLFLSSLEIVLALCGVEPLAATEDPYAGFAAALPHFEERAEIGEPPRMRTARNKLSYVQDQSFAVEKPAGAHRIFCLGGSTTYGQPYDDATSFVGWLRTLLDVAHPTREWEVVNAGGISYASYRALALMEELAEYEPDLFIVYTGHNEFLEERTYREVRARPTWLRRLTLAAAHTRTGALMHRLSDPDPPRDPTAELLLKEVETILDRTVGPTFYERDDKLRRQIVAHYERSLHRMVDVADAAGAEILFVRPAANLRNCSPFKSQPGGALSGEALGAWERHVAEGRELQAENRHEEAIAAFQAALQIDDRAAEVHYRLGRSLFALQEFERAEAALWRAVDEDICPLRMTSDLGGAFDRVAAERRVPVVDFHELLREDLLRDEGHPLLGKEHFVDHVHPTIDAHGRLAVALFERLREEGVLPDERGPIAEDALQTARSRIESQVDPAAHARAEAELARVLFWAGKLEEAGPLAVKALPHDADDPRTWLIAGLHLHRTGKTAEGLAHVQHAKRLSPNDPRIDRALESLGPLGSGVQNSILVPPDSSRQQVIHGQN